VFQGNHALIGQPRPLVAQPQGGRGQGGPPEETVDILIRRRRVKRQYSLTVDGQYDVGRHTFQRVNRLEVLQRANAPLLCLSLGEFLSPALKKSLACFALLSQLY